MFQPWVRVVVADPEGWILTRLTLGKGFQGGASGRVLCPRLIGILDTQTTGWNRPLNLAIHCRSKHPIRDSYCPRNRIVPDLDFVHSTLGNTRWHEGKLPRTVSSSVGQHLTKLLPASSFYKYGSFRRVNFNFSTSFRYSCGGWMIDIILRTNQWINFG